jgi:hypothetical protein
MPMMAQPPDLEARVTALEAQVRDLGERGATVSRMPPQRGCWPAVRIAT